MTEDEFKQLDELMCKALDDVPNHSFTPVNEIKIGQLLRVNKTLIGVARQLTRIADQGDEAPDDETWELVQALIKISKAPCISRLSGDPPEDFQPCGCASCIAKSALTVYESKPTLAPDALVEAVKDFLGDEICGGYEKPTWEKYSVESLKSELAVHEKAGSDGT